MDSGSIGIGTTTPYAKLSIVDTTASLRDVFVISTSTSGLIFKVDSYGATFADGAYTGTGADYAEYFFTNSTNLKSGEVVCVDVLNNNAVKRCERGADNNVMGIVSTKPSVIGNLLSNENQPSHYAIVGIDGRRSLCLPRMVQSAQATTHSASPPARCALTGTQSIALEPLVTGSENKFYFCRNKSLLSKRWSSGVSALPT